jgi:hypothetical protein
LFLRKPQGFLDRLPGKDINRANPAQEKQEPLWHAANG